MKKILSFCSLILLLPFLVCAESIQYEGSSTIGKFITDAARVYKKSQLEKNVDSES